MNYANLATAQAARRAREVGLRKALGGNRSQVMLQYLAESALLTLAAVAIALVAVRLLAPALQNAVGIDLSLGLFDSCGFWAFLAALLITVTVLGGAYPALVLSRVPPIEALRVGRTRVGPRFAGTVLVGVQFVAASFLLIVVIVMYAQNLELRRTGLGRTADPVLVISNFSQYSGVDPVLLQSELARLPQVTGLTESGAPPWNDNVNLMLLGRTPDQTVGFAAAYQSTVGYDFFSTLGFTVLAGRVFDREHGEDVAPENPMGSGQTLSVVVDDVLTRQFGFRSPQEAVDQTVYMPERLTRAFGEAAQPVRIIGVVASKPLNLRAAEATANLYMLRTGLIFQLVRISAADVAGGVAAIDALYERLSTTRGRINRDFMDDLFNESYKNFERINQVLAGLAFLAVTIAVIGLFGMAIQVASRRVHEVGVRKSVGARTTQVVAMLMRDFSKPVLIANLIAWPLAYFAAQQYLSVFMQRIALTPVPFVLSLAVALAIACAAVGGQALRAARVSPATVLRVDSPSARTASASDQPRSGAAQNRLELRVDQTFHCERIADGVLARDRERIVRPEHDAVGADLADQVPQVLGRIHERVVVELPQIVARRLCHRLAALAARVAIVGAADVRRQESAAVRQHDLRARVLVEKAAEDHVRQRDARVERHADRVAELTGAGETLAAAREPSG